MTFMLQDREISGAIRQRLKLSGGTELSFLIAGNEANPPILLLHGTPNSARGFRGVIPALAKSAHVIAADLPGFGESDPLPAASFDALTDALAELLEHLAIGPRFLYVHDYGAPVALKIAMDAPELVLGLIIQNANAHRSGWGPSWAKTREYWVAPNPENEAAATAHLTFEGTRDQYLKGVPEDITASISPENWEEDWRVMSLPGRIETQRALVCDYGHYAERFDAIADYLRDRQPPALMVWGRHDIYFEIDETLSWMKALPRMEAHILDGGHLLLETHADQAAKLMVDFIDRTSSSKAKG
ncbi:MAG: alpha/beta hydrolase [Pseudomonadota bacterium]|nr:alpha/beta hydrolase [Pseudomonadota bacterium]